MRTDNNKYTGPERRDAGPERRVAGPERRVAERRGMTDRRNITRFSDVLGRRSGGERRLPTR